MASRRLEDLAPDVEHLAELFLNAAEDSGIEVLVTCTYRSGIEQAALYAQGRTTKGKIVTNAKPGESLHNTMLNGKPAARAFDFVPMLYAKPLWDDTHPYWEKLGEIGESVGLKWGGRWKKPDKPHMELPESQTKEQS